MLANNRNFIIEPAIYLPRFVRGSLCGLEAKVVSDTEGTYRTGCAKVEVHRENLETVLINHL